LVNCLAGLCYFMNTARLIGVKSLRNSQMIGE
jgi:hypothetical protein